MQKTKYKVRKRCTHIRGIAMRMPYQRTTRIKAIIDLTNMSYDELIDTFSAITAINNGTSNSPITSQKVSLIVQRYRRSEPATKKLMLKYLSNKIVKQNEKENPLTPEVIEKIKKTFG